MPVNDNAVNEWIFFEHSSACFFFLEYIQQTQILCDSSEDLGTWLAHRVMLSNSMCKAYYFWTESSSMDFFGIIG